MQAPRWVSVRRLSPANCIGDDNIARGRVRYDYLNAASWQVEQAEVIPTYLRIAAVEWQGRLYTAVDHSDVERADRVIAKPAIAHETYHFSGQVILQPPAPCLR